MDAIWSLMVMLVGAGGVPQQPVVPQPSFVRTTPTISSPIGLSRSLESSHQAEQALQQSA